MSEAQYVMMQIGEEHYGVKVQQVISVERMLDISPVPRTLSYIKGVTNLRGTVTPVIDLRERVGVKGSTDLAVDSLRIVVVALESMTVGMIVDAVLDVVPIQEDEIEPAPAVVGGLQAVYLQGIAQTQGKILVLLNLEKILSDVEVSQLENIAEKATQ